MSMSAVIEENTKWTSEISAKLIAMYFPQLHTIPENDSGGGSVLLTGITLSLAPLNIKIIISQEFLSVKTIMISQK